MFRKRRETDVLVVGAGPVGLFTALQLAREGARVEVIDEQWRTAARSYALALHPQSIALLEDLGLAERLLAKGHQVDALAFYDLGLRRSVLEYSLLSSRHPYLLIVPQNELEQLFESELEKAGVKIQWNHRLARLHTDEDGVQATIHTLAKESTGYSVSSTEWVVKKEHLLHTRFVIGTDGHRSIVRRALDIDFPDLGGAQHFAVFECDTDRESSSEARVFFAEGKTNVLWPLGDGGIRFSFEISQRLESPGPRRKSRLTVPIGGKIYPYLTPEALHEFIEARAPWFDRRVENVRWSLAVRFERHLAASFGEGRVRLAGDAAHLASPVGIHSMNVGLREANELAGGIREQLGSGGSLDALDGIAGQFREEWLQLLGVEGELKISDDADPWVRERAKSIVSCVPASGEDLAQLLHSIGLTLS